MGTERLSTHSACGGRGWRCKQGEQNGAQAGGQTRPKYPSGLTTALRPVPSRPRAAPEPRKSRRGGGRGGTKRRRGGSGAVTPLPPNRRAPALPHAFRQPRTSRESFGHRSRDSPLLFPSHFGTSRGGRPGKASRTTTPSRPRAGSAGVSPAHAALCRLGVEVPGNRERAVA